MDPIFLDRIDTSPISSNTFDPHFFLAWLWVLVDSLNENLSDIENAFNLLTAIGYTQAQIITMNTGGQLGNGIILYDTTNDLYVGKQGGSLVKFTTTSYP